MAELADAHDLSSCEHLFMGVQVPLCALEAELVRIKSNISISN